MHPLTPYELGCLVGASVSLVWLFVRWVRRTE